MLEASNLPAKERSLWENGHAVFSSLRKETLVLDKRRGSGLSRQEEVPGLVLLLAELVAKVTYNAVDPDDPFDEESGHWIAARLREVVDQVRDEQFSIAAWNAVVGESRG